MLPLETEEQVEACRTVMKTIAPEIQNMIAERGENGKLFVEFDGLDFFGSHENTRVIYMKMKEIGPQFDLLKDIVHVIIKNLIDNQILEKHELSHIKWKDGKYFLEQYHLSLVNSSWGQNQLLKIHG
jgi:hypothetical protein